MGSPKTGQLREIQLDTVPPQDLMVEPLPTQGIEMELSLRHPATLQPAAAATVTSLFGQVSWRSAEPPAHCCEIKTEPHSHARGLVAEYQTRAAWLCRWAEQNGLLVVPLGAEPLAESCEVSRYDYIARIVEPRYGIAVLALSHGVGTQVNTHVADGDALLAGYRGLVRLAPILAGMFAASPFAQGRRAGVLSYRHVVRRALLNGGDPEQLPNSLRWEEYIRSHQALTAMGTWFATPFSLNGMIRLRPDRMCIENGTADVIAEPRHLSGLIDLVRRAVYRILAAYRDGEDLPPWFGPDNEAVRDAAFRASMLSAASRGSQGLFCTSELRAIPIRQAFAHLVDWVGEAGVPSDPTLPWAEAEAGLRDLLTHGSPAERLLLSFNALHPDCRDPVTGCAGCPAAVAEVCRRYGQSFHTLLAYLTAQET